ncbi:MAG: hypothetical protein JSW11_13595 [Candidatus Heimdallarchaeota archaeon]|nr:MAG: hypothetical protein JSW11_13595 [Candidatus Heimdallarchaeota archaeon]
MAKLIEKYLNQIGEKLKDKSIPAEYIEEFIDNLADQLATMLDEVQEKEPTLSLEDAEVGVLTQSEPVDQVVGQVIKELKTDDHWIPVEHITKAKFLQPFETITLSLLNRLDRALIYCEKHVRRFSKWYFKHENPVFTSFTFFITIILLTAAVGIIFTFFPSVYQTTTLPDNKTYYTLNRPFEPPGSYVEIISTEISSIFQMVIIIILSIGAIGYIGWRHSYRYTLMSGALLSLLIGLLWMFMTQDTRLLTISNRIIKEGHWSFTSDWVRAAPPTLGNFSIFVLNFIFSYWFYYIIFIVLVVSIGFLIKTIIRKNKIIHSRPRHLNTLLTIGLLLGCLVIVFSIPTPPRPPRMLLYTDAPIPPTNEPIIFEFDIDWTAVYQSRGLSEEYFTRLKEFGDLGFYFYEFFNLSLSEVNLENPDLRSEGSFTPILTEEEEPSISSQRPFALLGLLYHPNHYNGLSFQEIITTHLNDSYPFRGFTPSIDNTIKTIEWHVNGTEHNLTVNTIKYSSTTNGSEYIFSFDRATGWLMKAELTKSNDTWVTGLELETLTITRSFTYNQIENPEDYYNLDNLLLLMFFLGSGLVFLSCEGFYLVTKKKKK